MSFTEWLAPYLPYFWIFFMGLFLLYYAIADGMDLGIGIISLLPRWDEKERHQLVLALKGVWSSNQTWLVVLIGMLFGAFPMFYSIVLSTLYIPMMLMLLGLIFRGIGVDMGDSFQYRRFWHLSFAGGSLVATVGQGFALGGLLSGVVGVARPHELFAWVNPLSLLLTAGVILGYIMLGSTFLVVKTEGRVRDAGYRYARCSAFATAVVSIAVYLWVTIRYEFVAEKWVTYPYVVLMVLFPLLAALSFVLYMRGLWKKQEMLPLVFMGFMVLFSFVGLSVGFFPYMIPSTSQPMTIEQAATSPNTLMFMLAVTAVLLPIILGYNIFQYWVFRRKVKEEEM